MKHITIKSLMTVNPVFITPNSTLHKAAQKMKGANCGILPVGHKHQVQGVITDRDIVTRSTVNNVSPEDMTVEECMTPRVHTIDEGSSLQAAADLMHDQRVSRLFVTQNGSIHGILTFGAILRYCDSALEIENVIEHAVQGKKAA